MRRASSRTLAAGGTAAAGLLVGVVAFVVVGGLPGVLYAAGICLAAFVGALAIHTGRTESVAPAAELESTTPPERQRWRRKKHVIADLEVELAGTAKELEEHRHALANLATQLSRESEAARQNAARLEQRIRELEAERGRLQELVATERERFEHTLDELGGGIGGHAKELAELERELEALIAR